METFTIDAFSEIEVKDKEEEFCLLFCGLPILYDQNFKGDSRIFLPINPCIFDLNRGQTYIPITCLSVNEYFETIEYLSMKGYYNRIKFHEKLLHMFWSEYKYKEQKQVWSLERIQKEKDFFMDRVRFRNVGELMFEVRVDFNKLNKFREDIKAFSGYKFEWLKELPEHEFGKFVKNNKEKYILK